MVFRSHEEIKNERRLLCEVFVPANNYKIVSGLSVARNMIPSIKLVNTILDEPEEEKSISLDIIDWTEFLQHTAPLLKNATNINADEPNKIIGTAEALSGNFQLLAVSFYGSVTLGLKSTNVTSLFLCKEYQSLIKN